MTSWTRVEAIRASAMVGGVEARVADSLWMLARQWQVGEFVGDDAAQPAAIRVRTEWDRLTTISHGGRTELLRHDRPLEQVVEAAPLAVSGASLLANAARLGRLLRRELVAAGAAEAVGALHRVFRLHVPDDLVAMPGAGTEAATLIARRSIDAVALAVATDAKLDEALGELTPCAAGDRSERHRQMAGTVCGGAVWAAAEQLDRRTDGAFVLGGCASR